ncbi:MAG TPA: hypothetical protein VF421_16515, partial [Niabella sp.]
MKRVLLITCTLLLTMSSLNAQDQNADWANFGRFDSANLAVKQLPAGDRQVVFMGNSITEGWYRQDKDFFTQNKYN